VSKTDAGREILPAVEAVLPGRRVVSAGIAGLVPAAIADMHPSKPTQISFSHHQRRKSEE
jgi:hypothetical protein